LYDSISRHTDTLQALRGDIDAGGSSLLLDSINVHRTELNNLHDSIGDHRTDIDANLDSIAVHRIALDNAVDSIADHRADIDANTSTGSTNGTNISSNSVFIGVNTADISSLEDSVSKHTDTLQVHQNKIDALYDTAAAHLDTLQLHQSQIAALGPGTTYTAGNGLDLTGTAFSLGNTLTADVDFDGAYDFRIGNYTSQVTDIYLMGSNNTILWGETRVDFGYDVDINAGTASKLLRFNDASMSVWDEEDNKGLEYYANYDTNGKLDDDWIPSWRAVKSQLGGQDLNSTVTSPTVTEDGYVVSWNNTASEYELVANSGGGGVTSVAAGNGMDFTTITGTGSVTMGTPSSLTLSTTNALTTTSHTHALSIADFTSSASGLAPASGGGTSNYLRADGTWTAPTVSGYWTRYTSGTPYRVLLSNAGDHVHLQTDEMLSFRETNSGFYSDATNTIRGMISGVWRMALTTSGLDVNGDLDVDGEITGERIMKVEEDQVLYSNSSITTIVTLPADAVIWDVQIEVRTAFNGSSDDVLNVGVTGTANRYESEMDISTTGFKTMTLTNVPDRMTGSTNITFNYVDDAGDATAGEAYIYIHYSLH
jgi:hypothetical protein